MGAPVDPLPPGNLPDLRPLHGLWVRLEPVSVARHGAGLWESLSANDPDGRLWTYMGYGPWESAESFMAWLEARSAQRDPWFYAIVKRAGALPGGMAAYLRCEPAHGVVEIGHVWMAPTLQKTREATEAIYLMIRHAFDELGMRRLEWKCDALNAPSRKAAERFGFTFEGVFRQHMIVKGRNRDTAWYAMLDKDWPRIRRGFEFWLQPGNFDERGRQKARLQVG